MDFARELAGEDQAAALEILSEITHWDQPPTRNYQHADARLSHPLLAGAARAFFIKMKPGSDVYRHRDPPEVVDHFDTDHIVVSTNPLALICWKDAQGEHSVHLEWGKRYRILDRGVLHWAHNYGDTDRIHLLIEYPKQVSRRRA